MSRRYQVIGGGGVAFSSGGTTNNVIPKEDGTGGLKDSALTDNGTQVVSTEPIQLPAGTKTAAALQFTADGAGTGLFRAGTNNYVFSLGSNGYYSWDTTGFSLGNSAAIKFGSGDLTGVAIDTQFVRDGGAGILAQKNGNNDQLFRVYATNGGFWEHYSATELLTLSTGGTTTNTAANLLPANSIIHAVCCRVTTTITTATNWSVGDSTTAARFSASNATLVSGTTSVGLDHMSGAVTTLAAGPSQAAAATVRITTTGTPGAGVIRITVFASRFVAPTS